MKNLSDKNIFIGVAAFGALVVFLVYMFVFQDYNEKTSSLKSQNATLQTQVADMKVYYDRRDEFRQSKAELQAQVEAIVAEYPSEAREEDMIMMAVDMQRASNIQYKDINLDDAEEIYMIPAEEVVTAGVETLKEQITFIGRKITYNGALDYTSLKNCVQTIYSNRNRIGIHNISFKREEQQANGEATTQLKGNIDVSFYSMTGTGKEYTSPDMKDYIMGNDNPFNLIMIDEELNNR